MQSAYDVLIIGGGPAGVSAALTLRNRGKSVLICTTGNGALEKAHAITNYPGLPGMSGKEMNELFLGQARDAGAEVCEKSVSQLLPMGDSFSALVGEDILTCSAVILAVGTPRKAGLPGEKEGVGRGVSYCATCDGMFYKGKDIAVLGSWEESVEETGFLASIARSVLYFKEKPHDAAFENANVTVTDEKPTAILSDENGKVCGVAAGEKQYALDGVFILRPSSPPDALLPGLEMVEGRIKTDADGRTSLPRVYAAGDACCAVKQVAVAVGSGCLAALAAVKEL